MPDNITNYAYPNFLNYLALCRQMRDSNAGEHQIKNGGAVYLPMTDGQSADLNSAGKKIKLMAFDSYNRYKNRAIFPNYTADTIISMLGVMYAEKPKKLDLPSQLEEMTENATIYGDSLEMLMRRTNEEQLIVGRRGLLLDPPINGKAPKIVEYSGESIINWGASVDSSSILKLNFILLDESGKELKGLKWEDVKKYRLLAIDAKGLYYSRVLSDDIDFDGIDILNPSEPEVDSSVVYPQLLGKTLDKIPFVFINASSNLPDIGKVPLLALSDLCLAIYKGDADYRQHLYQQANDTLFASGFLQDELELLRVGAGVTIGSTSPDADLKYVGVTSKGLSEMRESQQNLHAQAVNMGIALVEQKQAESGEALQTRLSVKTASMKTIALSCARGIENLLRIAAEWVGANPADVVIEPNLDFSSSSAAAKDLLDLWNAKISGAPLSEKSIHEWMRKNDFTELDYESEVAEIENEGGTGALPIIGENTAGE